MCRARGLPFLMQAGNEHKTSLCRVLASKVLAAFLATDFSKTTFSYNGQEGLMSVKPAR